jgi:hypothetical protein
MYLTVDSRNTVKHVLHLKRVPKYLRPSLKKSGKIFDFTKIGAQEIIDIPLNLPHFHVSFCSKLVKSIRTSKVSKGLIPRALFLGEMRIISPVSFEWRLLE